MGKINPMRRLFFAKRTKRAPHPTPPKNGLWWTALSNAHEAWGHHFVDVLMSMPIFAANFSVSSSCFTMALIRSISLKRAAPCFGPHDDTSSLQKDFEAPCIIYNTDVVSVHLESNKIMHLRKQIVNIIAIIIIIIIIIINRK